MRACTQHPACTHLDWQCPRSSHADPHPECTGPKLQPSIQLSTLAVPTAATLAECPRTSRLPAPSSALPAPPSPQLRSWTGPQEQRVFPALGRWRSSCSGTGTAQLGTVLTGGWVGACLQLSGHAAESMQVSGAPGGHSQYCPQNGFYAQEGLMSIHVCLSVCLSPVSIYLSVPPTAVMMNKVIEEKGV